MHLEIEVIGNIGNDAIVKESNGRKVVNFSVAHTKRFKKADGTQVENTTWINCSYWDADKVAPYLKKGTMVLVKGEPAVSLYQNKAGQHVADIRCQVAVLRLLSKKQEGENKPANEPGKAEPYGQPPPPDFDPPLNDHGLPF